MYLDLKYKFKTWLNHWNKPKVTQIAAPIVSENKVHESVNEIINTHHQFTNAIVITPTTGSVYLEKAMKSVQNQDYSDVRHLVVVDGNEFWKMAKEIAEKFDSKKYDLLPLPYNTGRNGMNGHRIYAALPLLINAGYVFFLDQDNWFEPNHISSMINTMEKESLEWVFAMRKIYKEDEEFVTHDNCESIGDYPCFSRLHSLVDTNCYGFRRSTLVKSAHHWYHPLRADRYFFYHLKKESPKFKSSGLYTVNYRLTEGRPPFPEFFINGNKQMQTMYRGNPPWQPSGITSSGIVTQIK